jgi:hypothetical protein
MVFKATVTAFADASSKIEHKNLQERVSVDADALFSLA